MNTNHDNNISSVWMLIAFILSIISIINENYEMMVFFISLMVIGIRAISAERKRKSTFIKP